MAAAKGCASTPHYSIRTIWGLAKSPELSLDEGTLYTIVLRETGKESMRKLSQSEIDKICRVLLGMKDGTKDHRAKRTDEGGNPTTVKLRRKIYALTEELGWNNDVSRINGFCKRMCGVDRIEWLRPAQCHIVIEGLKKIVERKEEEEGDIN